MCPFFILTFIFSVLVLLAEVSSALIGIEFQPERLSLHDDRSAVNVKFQLKLSSNQHDSHQKNVSSLPGRYRIIASNPEVADVIHGADEYQFHVRPSELQSNGSIYQGTFNVAGKFLGYSSFRVEKLEKRDQFRRVGSEDDDLLVTVRRTQQLIQKIFIISVATVVSISYINMGCALDTSEVVSVLRRPVGPAIGLFSQYVCMPLISYAVAQLLFTETYLKLGLFIFGCSPGGGASNMWAVLLGGNLNLSITMTFLSTLLSFLAMPFWLYTLGRNIFEDTHVNPPARSIFTTLGSMLIFLSVGLLIKRYCPKMANLCRRILAPFSAVMIVFIIVFGTYSNFFMFRVMTWKMFLASALNVWSGMAIGAVIASLFGKSLEDIIAIAIETGVQNTGVSIVLLGVTLGQPDADLASAVPVSASIMTPIPLTIAYFFLKLRNRYSRKSHLSQNFLDSDSSLEKGQINSNHSCRGIYRCANGISSSQTVADTFSDSEADNDSSKNSSIEFIRH